MELKLTRKEIKEIQDTILKRVEAIVFSTNRSTAKKDGTRQIKDRSGDLRNSIKGNKDFIKVRSNKITIDIETMSYYLFLDEGTKHMNGWFLTEAIFEDKIIREKIKEVTTAASKRATLNMLSVLGK
jgi:gas vesicle protein